MIKRRKPFASVSFSWLLPNLLTVGGLVAGLTALRFALEARWDAALVMVAVAAICDGLDGRMARLLKSTSAFGAALDSLSDAVVFGIVPALCLYLWALQDSGNFAFGTALFYSVCVLLRLARFDSELPDQPEYKQSFFVGIPAPAAAFLVLVPIVIYQEFSFAWLREPYFVSLVLIMIGAGAVSTLPTFNGKKIRVPGQAILPLLALFALIAALIFTHPWKLYLAIAAAYVASFPFSIMLFLKVKTRYADKQSSDK